MAPPIRIEWLEGGEAMDLISALAVRGLIGSAVREGSRHAVAIHSPREDPARLLDEVVEALGAWLADRGRDSVAVRVGDRQRTVLASGGLPGVLRARVGQRRQQGGRARS